MSHSFSFYRHLGKLFINRTKFLRLFWLFPQSTRSPLIASTGAVMDISRSQFPTEVVNIIQQIAQSHFVAFDLEFSGVAGRRKTPAGAQRDKLTLQEYYEDVKKAAEKYQILQVGLTIVQEDLERAVYTARPYNFNLNPLPAVRERYLGREWSHHSGAIDFLLRNGFKFDLPVTQGIPYLSRKEETEVRQAMIQEETEKATIVDMPLKSEDKPLIDHIRSIVLQWQTQAKSQQTEYVNIPEEGSQHPIPASLNRYQVRLTHQIVRTEFPKLKTHGMGTFVQVTNPTDQQQASQYALQAKYRESSIAKAIGFRFLFDAIVGRDISAMPKEYFKTCLPGGADPEKQEAVLEKFVNNLQSKLRLRRKILVGHNCFTDFVNLYKCFEGDLPQKVEDFAESVHALFPAIVDTKHLASFDGNWNTSLEEVELEMSKRNTPKIEIPSEFDRYRFSESYHEAGYDSLQTAKVAIKFSAKLEKQKKLKLWPPIDCSNVKGFGIGDEGDIFHTVSESQQDEAISPTLVKTISDALASPITTVMNFFKPGSTASTNHAGESTINSQDEVDRFTKIMYNARPLVKSVSSTDKEVLTAPNNDEVENMKSAFSHATIYDVLDKTDEESVVNSSDVAVYGSNDDEQRAQEERKKLREVIFRQRLTEMVNTGEVMPPWDGESKLWHRFGNKLQVNGTFQGICKLTPP